MTSCFHVYPSLHPFLRPLLIRSDPQYSLPPAGVMLSEYSRWQAWQGTREWTQHNSATWLLSSHICSSFVLLLPYLPVLCQFMMAFVVWDWDSMLHFKCLQGKDVPLSLTRCSLISATVDASSWWQSSWTPLRNVQSDIHQPWSNVQCHYRDNRWFSQASIFLLL